MPVRRGVKEAAAERQVKAMELRKGGGSYRQIARALGVSVGQAFADVKVTLVEARKRRLDLGEDTLELELERLDGVLRGHYGRAVSGDDKSARVVISAGERRARLLGLDKPDKHVLTDPEGAPVDLAALVAQGEAAIGEHYRKAIRRPR